MKRLKLSRETSPATREKVVERPLAKGRKTRLRFLRREDVDAMVRWGRHDDPLLAGYNMRQLGPRERDHWYRSRASRPDFRMFAICDRKGNLVGRLSIREIDNRRRQSRLGIALDPDRVDQDLGTDAVAAFLDFYFNHLRFETLVLDVAAFNLRARRCYEKCGFRYTGERWVKDAELADRAGVAIFSEERYADLRKFFRQTFAGLEVLTCDMAITRQEYLARQNPPA